MTPDVTFKEEDILHAFAAMKDIPVSKIIRNASKDFAVAARKATPMGKTTKSDWAKLQWDGTFHFIKISYFMLHKPRRRYKMKRKHDLGLPYHGYSYQLQRLLMARMRPAKGWSNASWIGIYHALGIAMKPSKRSLPPKVEDIGKVTNSFYNRAHSEVIITDDIRFNSDEWRTAEAMMCRKGFQAAAKKITKEYARMLRENERGVIKYDPGRSS